MTKVLNSSERVRKYSKFMLISITNLLFICISSDISSPKKECMTVATRARRKRKEIHNKIKKHIFVSSWYKFRYKVSSTSEESI